MDKKELLARHTEDEFVHRMNVPVWDVSFPGQSGANSENVFYVLIINNHKCLKLKAQRTH